VSKGLQLALVVAYTAIVLYPLYGLAVMLVWRWFVVPLGLPEIGLAHALGLTVIAKLLTANLAINKLDTRGPVERLADKTGFVLGGMVLAYVTSLFM